MSNNNTGRVSVGARLDRLPNSSWHIKMWLVSAFALLVCWSNGISGAVQNILLNEIHWLEPGSTLLAMWGTTYTAGQLFGALVGGPIGDKIGRKKSILLYEAIHIVAMIGGMVSPNIYVLYIFRLVQGFGLGALLVVLFAAFTEYVPGRNRGCMVKSKLFHRKLGSSDLQRYCICNRCNRCEHGNELENPVCGSIHSFHYCLYFLSLRNIRNLLDGWKLREGRKKQTAILDQVEKEIEASTGKPLPPVEEVEAKTGTEPSIFCIVQRKTVKKNDCRISCTGWYEYNSVYIDDMDAFSVSISRI